jgi:type IV secretion system protein VirB9
MRKTMFFAMLFAAFGFPPVGGCSGAWAAVSGDIGEISADAAEKPDANSVEIEYDGKIISVDYADLLLMSDGDGGQKLELSDPEKYAEQLKNAPVYGEGQLKKASTEDGFQDMGTVYAADARASQEITERQYEEEQNARKWADIVEDLTLRKIDERALELVKEYGEAKSAVPPMTGVTGSVVIAYGSYTPKVVCRPMYVTDVILQPGEHVTGVHPGDGVRWTFTPGKSGLGDAEQVHVLIKPLMADISTNLVINTDMRTYQLDLMSSDTDFIPSVSFSYPMESLKDWDAFIAEKKKESEANAPVPSGYSLSLEDLHLDYEIRGKESLRWKPVRVWDDGVKTYIQFRKGSKIKSVEAPVLVVFEHRKEVLVNYRVAEDMYVVDKVFDSGALIAGTGAAQDRIVIKRLRKK